MILRIFGKDLGKVVGYRVIVKFFLGVMIKVMNYYFKFNLEFLFNEVILYIGINDFKIRELKVVVELIVDFVR